MTYQNEDSPFEYQLKDDDTVFFLHVTKTAGTTFISILDSYFDHNSIYPEQLWHELLKKRQS